MTDFEWLDSGPNCSEGHYSIPFQNPHSANPVYTTNAKFKLNSKNILKK